MKKGFTLVELLGAIILLGLISLLIAVPIVARINNASGKISRATERILKEHVMQYISENSNDFRSTKPGTKYYITLDELEFNRDGFEVKINNKDLDPSTQVLIEINENGDYDISVVKESDELPSIKETYADGAYVIFNGFTWRMISKDDNTKTVRLACNETVGGVFEYAEQDYLNSQTYKWLNNEFASKLNYINVIKETDNGLINILTLAESNANPLEGFRYYVVNEEGKIKASTNVNTDSLIRPAINVYEGTVITGGTGTESDPYILREYKNNQSESTFKEADISVGEYISFDDKLYRIIEYGSDTIKLISTFSDGKSAYANEGETFNLNNGAGAYLNNPSRVSKYMVMNNVFVGSFYQNDYTKSLKKTNVIYGVYKALPKAGEIIPYPLDNKEEYRLMTMNNSTKTIIIKKEYIGLTNFASPYDLLYTTYISANNIVSGGTGTKDDPYTIGELLSIGTEYDFAYTGDYQEFVVPKNGRYKIELWGAEGGPGGEKDGVYSYGGYVSGNISLSKSQKLYIYVGEAGAGGTAGIAATSTVGQGARATFNGGGAGGNAGGGSYPYQNYSGGPSGGGATDVRYFSDEPTNSDLLWNSSKGLQSRIMVAGAGGGTINHNILGGNNNGLQGQQGSSYTGYANYGGVGGTQTSGYAFGQGGRGSNSGSTGYCNGHSGGGGGYYGGGGAQHTGGSCYMIGGGGGSSYISGHAGSVAIKEGTTSIKDGCTASSTSLECSIHYSGLYFTDTQVIGGTGCKWTTVQTSECNGQPQPDGTTTTGHAGNGYAKITYLGN